MILLNDLNLILAIGITVLTLGIGIGKLLYVFGFLKGKVNSMDTRVHIVEKEQIEIKIILKQIAKKLKLDY